MRLKASVLLPETICSHDSISKSSLIAYQSGKLAMYFGSSSGVKMFQDQGINTTFLPFFQKDGEKWLMTTPYFQVALNSDLAKNEARRKKAIKVLNTMLSEDAQKQIIYDGQDLLSYSQDVNMQLSYYHEV